jgi:hypothetical protein
MYYGISIDKKKPVSRAWIKFYELLFITKIFDKIKGKETQIDTYYLGYYLKDWLGKSKYGTYTLPENKSAFDLKGKNTELRLILNQIEYAQKGQDFEIRSLNGIVLIRETKAK